MTAGRAFEEHGAYTGVVSDAAPYAELLRGRGPREASIAVLGRSCAYWTYGPEDAPVTVVLVHGYRGDHHGLEPVVAQLDGVRIISPDLPGFGRSERLASRHDIDGYANWLVAFVRALALAEPPVLIGHSFGSIVASAAVARGLTAERLVLINPIAAPALSGPNRGMSVVTLGYYRASRALPRALGAALLSNWAIVQGMSVFLAKTRDRALRRWIHAEHHRYFSGYADRDSVVEGFEASISSDVGGFAAEITVPTLLIAAAQDPISPVAAQERLLHRFPDARLAVIEGVGHLIHYEKPEEAAALISGFVDRGRSA